jgi:hypothetical protein
MMATPARLNQEIVAARQMLDRAKERFGCNRRVCLPTKAMAQESF